MPLNPDSTLEIEEINPVDDARWDAEVSRHARATIFHESAWARVLVRTYGHRPAYLRISRGGKLAALVPMMELRTWPKGKRGIALPFADFCSPLCFQEDAAPAVRRAVESIARERSWRYAELRGTIGDDEEEGSLEGASFVGHKLELVSNAEEQLGRLDGAARRSLRKAERQGLQVSMVDTWSAMQKFFRLHERTRRRHGLPPQPLSFFRNIQSALFTKGKGFISLVEKDGRPVAGAVFFVSGTRALYKFGASDERFLSARPNHLAMWEGIRALIARGCEVLHFGRTSEGQEGLRRFKRSWGAREYAIRYGRLEVNRGQWTVKPGETAPSRIAGLRFMPLQFSRLAGRVLYPRLD